MEQSEQVYIREFTDESPNFALVIDGEVASNFAFPTFQGPTPPMIEMLVAIFKSNPTIIPTLENIEPGSTWDGQQFTPPVGQ